MAKTYTVTVQFYVGVTDESWYRQLAATAPDEVNFWRPSPRSVFKALEPGEPFLFKLHSPKNYIVGGGFFVSYSRLPVSIAWLSFGANNGVLNREAFLRRILKYRRDQPPTPDPLVGCIVLTEPFFFKEDAWIPVPEDWRPNIVQGKGYSTSELVGQKLWQQVQERLNDSSQSPLFEEPEHRYGRSYLTKARLGQGAFRVLVTDAYARQCAVTGEKTLPVLEAAHIRPFSAAGPNTTNNGLLLRADLHILFDRGYLTVDRDYRVVVSSKIREEYLNGRHYYALGGQRLSTLPQSKDDLPEPTFLHWHNNSVFVP